MEAEMANRRITTLLIIMLSALSSIFAARAGIALSGSGQAGKDEGSSLNAFVILDTTNDEYFTVEGSLRLGSGEDGSWGFEGLTADISVSPLQILNHPFNFLFQNNTLWAPKLGAGIMTSREIAIYYSFSFSLMHFREAFFTYDILAPYVYFDSRFDYAGWGIELMKVSYFF